MKKIFALIIAIALVGTALAEVSPRTVHYPVTLERIGSFIKDLGYTFDKVNTQNSAGKVAERLALDIRGDEGTWTVGIELLEDVQILYIYVEDYLDLPLENPGTVPMLTYLMNQNWKLTFGRLEWNISTGEVRLGHTLPIDDGLSAEVFGAYLSSIVSIADEKYPEYIITIENFAR